MQTESRTGFRHRQRGAMTILLALFLVAVMGAATFSLSRNAIREISMAGTIMQGNRAATAADAGLDWVIVWGQGGLNQAAVEAAAAADSQQLKLVKGIKSTLASTTGYAPVSLRGTGVPAMSLNQNATAGTDQSFDIELRFLGNLPSSLSGGGSSNNASASGGTAVGGATGDYLWRALATGRATPKDGGTYQAQRELIATLPPF